MACTRHDLLVLVHRTFLALFKNAIVSSFAITGYVFIKTYYTVKRFTTIFDN
jgi:hypothetical protein